MTCIYLGCTKGSYSEGGGVTITVTCDDSYPPCKLFNRYKHQLQSPRTGNIYVFKGSNGSNRSEGYLTLMANKSYKAACLEKVDVYFNQHDNKKTPLVLVFQFKKGDGENGIHNKYYRMSNYDTDKASCKSINQLCDYKDDKSILCALIQENDALKELLTYDIMQRPTSGNGDPCTYNCNKINVTKNGDSQPQLGEGFTRYKHQPGSGAKGVTKACVTYLCQALLKDGGDELEGVQGVSYSCVTVYFGQRAKRPCTHKGATPGVCVCPPGAKACTKGEGSTCTTAPDGTTECQDVPLLLALQKQGSGGDGATNDPDYYVHRRKKNGGAGSNTDQYYWVKLNGGDNGQENGQDGLKQLLSEIGLSSALSGENGTKVSDVLAQPANGDTGPTYLDLLLKRLEFDLTDSVVILLDKTKDNCSGGYDDTEIQKAIKTLEPGGKNGNINPLKLGNNGGNIQVSDANNGQTKCLTDRKYRVVAHDFKQAVTGLGDGCHAGLRFLIPRKENGTDGVNGPKYAELKLYQSDKTKAADLEYKYYTRNGVTNGAQTDSKVYVVFYAGTGDGSSSQGDPRPLLLCYGKQAYRAANITGYDAQQWVKVEGVNNCLCQNGGSDGSDTQNQALLKAVTEVVGFLNKVQLEVHPGMTKGAEQQCTTGTTSAPGAVTTCQAGTSNGSGECKYDVHQFQSYQIKVKVECQAVKGSNGSSCYKKLIHQPAGINGDLASNANFRLGDVEYCKNGGGGSGRTGSIKYYQNGSNGVQNVSDNNKYNPLVKVWAYFYNDDKTYQDPLLVVLEFANGGTDNNKECYKLTKSNGSRLAWENDGTAKSLVDAEGSDLVRHLDAIRYCLKKVVRIRLEYNGSDRKNSYELKGRNATSAPGSQFDQPINGSGTVNVTVQECTALSTSNYKCYRHCLTQALEGKHDKVAGLAFTLPGAGGKVIEIPLDPNDGKGDQVKCANGPGLANGQSGSKITYNQCMGDVCVYFYHPANGSAVEPRTTDTVPLMLLYNGQFYRPCDRDSYFQKWVCVPTLCAVDKKCCCSGQDSPGGHGDGCQQLVDKLNEVNQELNQVDLYPKKDRDYGLPENGQGSGSSVKVDTGTFPTERVKVVTQKGPKPPGTHVYERVVHRTKNGFQIGEITYDGKDIKEGITPNGAGGGSGDTTIPIANGGHKDQVSKCQWNTVVSYYSCSDKDKKLPQLIVLLKTDKAVNNGETVTGSTNTPYGYYILATKNGVGSGSGYEYQWRLVNGDKQPTAGVKLDDETDFKLLNAAVLLVEARVYSCAKYGEGEISGAVTKAIRNGSLEESPGRSGQDINRLTGKNITVTEEKSTGGGSVTHQCLNNTGFRVMAHCLDNLVNLGSAFNSKLSEVKLITGLRFLIPTNERGKYKQVTLLDNGLGTGSGIIKYHQNGKNKVCIYFYDKDPRPLLVCYNGWAYAAKDKNDYDAQKWTKVTELDKCGCTKPPPGTCQKCKLLGELVKVSDFLNPVYINLVVKCPKYYKHYFVQEFNGQLFWILVTAKPACGSFCFDRYTHTHAGTKGRSGKGFRLGDIYYKQECIKENGTKTPLNGKCISASDVGDTKTYKPSPEVVVYYYKGDRDHRHPLLVALSQPNQGTNSVQGTTSAQKYSPYFELQKKVDPGQPKLYTRGKNGLNLADTRPDGELAKKLDSILFNISQKLRVVLAERPVPTKYSATGAYPKELDELKGFRETKEQRLTQMAETAEADPTRKFHDPVEFRASLTHHVLRETQYQAQLFEANGSQAVSTPPTQSNLKITVREVDCHKSYSEAGYRCFRHQLMSAENIEDVGGLKLAVFSEQGGQGEIKLCPNESSSKPFDVTYTTCKGDLYVFFYGDDPRPLMLCYDNHAYCPKDMAGYCTQWVKVSGAIVDTSKLEIPFRRVGQVLNALYQVSVFMNPVRLCLGQAAIKAMEHKRSDAQAQSSDTSAGSSTQAKQEWTYTIDQNPPQCVRVRVTPRDLNCYRVYTHKPAIHGYRLGSVTYAEAKGEGSQEAGQQGQTCQASSSVPGTPGPAPAPTTTPYCFAYDSSKQLLSVCVYYYMYDKCHNWPLVVELGFRGQSSEFFRLCCKGSDTASGSNGSAGVNGAPGLNGKNGNSGCSASKPPTGGLRWVRMTHDTVRPATNIANSSCQNGQGDLCQPCNTGTDSQSEDGKKMCQEDAEFVKRAQEIHHAIYETDRHDSLFLGDRVPLERDLNDLIERRALEIRTQLGIEYTKEEKCLILATSSRCWEDSIVAYVVGGGFLGVAGGGGWKIAVAVLGLVVKL